MKKVMLIGDHGWDYEYCGGFEDSGMTIEELANEVNENNGDWESEKFGFGASFLDFETELTENDIELINDKFLDSHESHLFLVEVK